MPSTTVKAIRGRVAERAYAGRYAPIVSTATGGAVGTVVDSAYAIPGATTDHFDWKIIKIATDAGGAGAAPEGEVRYISEGGYTAATGTFATEVADLALDDIVDLGGVYLVDFVGVAGSDSGGEVNLGGERPRSGGGDRKSGV